MQDQPDYLTKNHIRILDGAHRELQPSQINWYSEDATNYTFKQDPAARTRWVRSVSIFPAPMASICTTRRLRTCLATIFASIRRAVCGCRMSGNWLCGCLRKPKVGHRLTSIG